MKLWQDFCILTAGYTKSYYMKKSLKAVNNTPAPEILRLLTCQNCQWFVSHIAEINNIQTWARNDRLINGYGLLLENDVSFFWVFLTPTHWFYQHETIFAWYFWIVTNTKIYFWDISETSENKHLFEICLRRLKDVTWKTSFMGCIWDVIKRSMVA